MRKNKPSIDGFTSRRPGVNIGDYTKSAKPLADEETKRDMGVQDFDPNVVRRPLGLSRSEIDDSLRDIDDSEERTKKRRRRRRVKRAAPPRRKIIKRLAIFIGVLLLCVAGFIGIKAFLASSNIFKGNLFGIFQNQPLKMDQNGRSNILLFGTSGTAKNLSHPGANLTDTIMVISIDQNKKDAFMVSIPRDLYVDYGDACPEGYQGKINSFYSCKSNNGVNEAAGANALKQKVGEVVGLDIQYYSHVNWSVLEEAVNAVGGIEVTIESSDPRGIYDVATNINFKNGEVVHLNGERALAFTRARNSHGGYGLSGGNFDREKNQQKVIKALREKAVSAGTLTNIGKVTALIDAFGNNLQTNFETSEIRTLMDIAASIATDKIQSISLVEEGNMLVTTGNINGASIVQPTAGLYDYSEIQAYISKQLNANAVTREAANVVVLNGSEVSGVAQTEADALEGKGFTIARIGNAPTGEYDEVEVYQVNEDNPATASKLKQLFSLDSVKQSPPPTTIAQETDFVVIFGASRSLNN